MRETYPHHGSLPVAVHVLSRLALRAAACLLGSCCAYAGVTAAHPSGPVTPFDHADELRAELESRPPGERTWIEYERVLNAYRAIYHGDPGAAKADASINAVAELLAEEGRLFAEQKPLHDAAGQYEFLRQNYPFSRYRFSALIAEGEIYRNDIGDHDQAKTKFEEFVKKYPRNALAVQARTELKELRAESRDTEVDPAPQAGGDVQESRLGKTSGAQPSESPLPDAYLTKATLADDSSPHHARSAQVRGIRYWSTAGSTRIAIDLEDQVEYQAARVPSPDRIYFDLHGTRLASDLIGKSVTVADDGFLKRIRAAQFSNDVTRIVLDVSPVADYSAFFLPNPWRLIIDVHGRQTNGAARSARKPGIRTPDELANLDASLTSAAETAGASSPAPLSPGPGFASSQQQATAKSAGKGGNKQSTSRASAEEVAALGHQPDRIQATPAPTTGPIAASVAGAKPIREAAPTADGERSLVRALGLKIGRIVIDAGHGGYDSGTLGPGGLEEKDVVLDVALRLGKLLQERLGAEVVYTRTDDTFVPLETRTAVANQAQADLFISIHANSSPDTTSRGVETYYLNFTTSADALEVAARENAVSDESIHELSDLVKKITLKDKIEESQEFAADVERSLYRGLEQGNPGFKDRGVKKAPFVVLIGANMPSILAEISFLTNPGDAHELRQAAYRERISESLYHGVAKYISGLSGLRLAQNSAASSGN